jgi:hypothetical protein
MFECTSCNFSSVRSTDLKRHEQSKKHILNIHNEKNDKCDDSIFSPVVANAVKNEEFVCTCSKIFKHRQSLFKHKKTCTYITKNGSINDILEDQSMDLSNNNQLLVTALNKINELTNSINKQSNEMNNMKTQLEQLTNNTQITNNTNSNNTNSNNTTNNYNNKTINVFAYVNSNYDKTKPLELLKQKDIAKLLILDDTYSTKHSIEDVLIYEYDKYTLNKFIGDIIIKEYKKENPKDQKIWSSDTSRLTFIVRRVLDKNKKIWSKDKGGICINDFVVTPILEEVKVMINEYNNSCNMKIILPKSDYDVLSNKINSSIQIIYDITTNKLHKSILSYVAPYFQLDM